VAPAALLGAIDAFSMNLGPAFIEHCHRVTLTKIFLPALGEINREPLCDGERLVAIVHWLADGVKRPIVTDKPEAIVAHLARSLLISTSIALPPLFQIRLRAPGPLLLLRMFLPWFIGLLVRTPVGVLPGIIERRSLAHATLSSRTISSRLSWMVHRPCLV
jgi:hypothetical protein